MDVKQKSSLGVKQIAILTATVVGLVVVVTLLKVGLGGQGGAAPGPGPLTVGQPHLTFSMPQGPKNKLNPNLPSEEEVKIDGHYDFWFTNDKDAPVDVYLKRVSCNKCLEVSTALAPEGWDGGKPAGSEVSWVVLKTEELNANPNGFTVPPKRAGWVRLTWKDEEPGQKLLSADLRTISSAGQAPNMRLEYNAIFVDPVRVGPDEKDLNVGTLATGEDRPRTVNFIVYSSTRDDFTLDPEPEERQKERHPFVTCGKPVPLTPEECRNLEKEVNRAFRCGYKVPVTVVERLKDGREHDLGEFRHGVTVTVKNDVAPDDDVSLYVHGTVRGGGVKVVGDEKIEDHIVFGTFRRDSEAVKTVRVETPRGTKLSVEKKPDFMQTELKDESDGEGKTWGLTVTIRAGALNGHFPQPDNPALSDTAVYLKAGGRLLRIPVSGTASQH